MTTIATRNAHILLRRALPADAGLMLTFVRKLADFQRMPNDVTSTADSLRKLLDTGRSEAVFALYDGVAVGFMAFSQTSSVFSGRSGLFIDAFFVDAPVRHTGLGKMMMAFLAQEAAARDCQMLEWGCLDWNAPALAFYQGLGAYCLDTMRIYRLAPDRMQVLADGF